MSSYAKLRFAQLINQTKLRGVSYSDDLHKKKIREVTTYSAITNKIIVLTNLLKLISKIGDTKLEAVREQKEWISLNFSLGWSFSQEDI